MKTFQYTLSGTDGYRREWQVMGEVTCDLADLMNEAMYSALDRLTWRRGCQGPYTVRHLEFDAKESNSGSASVAERGG